MHTLRLTPRFVTVFSSSWVSLEEPRTAPFLVPASVRVLHLLSRGSFERRTTYTPTLAGASLRELRIDTDAWDAAAVRTSSTQQCCCSLLRKPSVL